MTSRRSFLATLAGAFALDPERALWTPGAKTISIPFFTAPGPGKIGKTLHVRTPARFVAKNGESFTPEVFVVKFHPYTVQGVKTDFEIFDLTSRRASTS